ncbi:hypothetical protein IMZ48_10265 [Candidatus Bathyarchaeota archaeon]|nr:hypothetical protein [Candidatus Bathyarchaeota archaeon]
MCYYKRTRHSCNHARYTLLLRPCRVQVEHNADPEGCAPCTIQEAHPMHTLSVSAECLQCRRTAKILKQVKAELGAIRARVEKLELARGLATVRVKKRIAEMSDEGAEVEEGEAGVVEAEEENDGELEVVGECLELWLGEAREKSSDLVPCEAHAADFVGENEGEGEAEVRGDGEEAGKESGDISPGALLSNVQSSW